jgi:hypothetical protein
MYKFNNFIDDSELAVKPILFAELLEKAAPKKAKNLLKKKKKPVHERVRTNERIEGTIKST